jgi:hypothetical protein
VRKGRRREQRRRQDRQKSLGAKRHAIFRAMPVPAGSRRQAPMYTPTKG